MNKIKTENNFCIWELAYSNNYFISNSIHCLELKVKHHVTEV
jgi:hypothetical protein